MKKPTPAQVRKFRYSDEFTTLAALADCGRESLYEHLSSTDWDAYEAARDKQGWKCDIVEDLKKISQAQCSALDEAETEAFRNDPDFPLRYMAAEQNAQDTLRENPGIFEEGSYAFYRCIISGYEAILID